MSRELSPVAQRSQTRGLIIGILSFVLFVFGLHWNFFLSILPSIVVYFVVTFGSMYLVYLKTASTLTKGYKSKITRVKNLYENKYYIVITEPDKSVQGQWLTLVALDRGKDTGNFPALMSMRKYGQKIDAIDPNHNMQTIHLTDEEKYTPEEVHFIVEKFIEEHRQNMWTDVCGAFRKEGENT